MRLINADELKSKFLEMGCMDDKPCYGAEIIDRIPTVKAVPIPDNATNGDMIKALFPDCVKDNDFGGAVITTLKGETQYWKKDWWNAPYKGSDSE